MKNYWYEEKIEEPLVGIVRYLRNNGINTECSCGHEMYIQCQYILDGSIKNIHDLVWNYLDSKGLDIDFDILVHHEIRNRIHCQWTSLNIKLSTDEEFKKGLKE